MMISGTNLSVDLQEKFITEGYFQKRILLISLWCCAHSIIKDTSVYKVQNACRAKKKYRGHGRSQCNNKKGAQQQPSHRMPLLKWEMPQLWKNWTLTACMQESQNTVFSKSPVHVRQHIRDTVCSGWWTVWDIHCLLWSRQGGWHLHWSSAKWQNG